eukprot:scaffold1484_cov241-Pinguiococcus_pyrenoidosus.AAC.28
MAYCHSCASAAVWARTVSSWSKPMLKMRIRPSLALVVISLISSKAKAFLSPPVRKKLHQDW